MLLLLVLAQEFLVAEAVTSVVVLLLLVLVLNWQLEVILRLYFEKEGKHMKWFQILKIRKLDRLYANPGAYENGIAWLFCVIFT